MSAPNARTVELLTAGGTAWLKHTLARIENGEGSNPDVWRLLAGYAMEVTRHLEPATDELQRQLSPGENWGYSQNLKPFGACPAPATPCDDPHCIVCGDGTRSGMAYDD